jgi:hypothetical protein
MKKFLLLFVFAIIANSYLNACTHTLRITDTYGDGWNGGTVKVRVNGVDVLTNVGSTFTTGSGPINFTFNANAGDAISIIETAAGSYPTEMRCEVLDGAGGSMGAAFDPNTVGTAFIGSCPAPMTVASATVTQSSTAVVQNCASDQIVVALQVTMSAGSSINMTQIQANLSGTAAASAFSSCKIYYTETSSTFATTTLFGTATPTVATFSVNGSQALSAGTNYFWLTLDLNNTGAVGATVDAVISQFTANAVNYNSGTVPAITTTNPAGSRSIILCLAPGGVNSGLETWLRADMGTTGVASMTGWANQASGTATNLNGNPSLNQTTTAYNYNYVVDFAGPAGTLDGGIAANRQCILLNGYSGITGVDYKTVFFAFQLNDLTRVNTHIATVRGVTMSSPANGTWHGDNNGTTASILLEAYDITDFGTSAPANTWQRNQVSIASNSNHSSTKHILSALCQTGGSTTLNTFLGGQNDQTPASSFAGHVRDWKGPVGEIIGFRNALTATERIKVDSYLAIKYGITLPNNYLSTSGTNIFTVAAPYNNNIIGIGRDDSELLTQKQSHYDDDNTRIYMGTLAAMNPANGSTFSVDGSYVMMGDNNGAYCATTASNAEIPTGLTNCTLYSRLEREWKVTRTNMAQNYNMDVKLAACGVPGSVNVSHLRLLVDDDGNFANGGTQCYYNGDGTGIVFSYSNPTITITGISTTHIPNNATKYITIASINVATPLPVALLDFQATYHADHRNVDLTWQTQSEHNSDYFDVQKLEGNEWMTLDIVKAKGESQTLTSYATIDPSPVFGENYYRLKQVDLDGNFTYSTVRLVNLEMSTEVYLFPNPAQDRAQIVQKGIANNSITILDESGRKVTPELHIISEDSLEINTGYLANGVYLIYLENHSEVLKLTVKH